MIHHAEAAAAKLFAERLAFVSPGVITLPDDALGFHKGAMALDPDRHALQLIER